MECSGCKNPLVEPTSTNNSSTPILGRCGSNPNFFGSADIAVSSSVDSRMKTIAARLLQLCDRFDEEFSEPRHHHLLRTLLLWRRTS